MGEESKIPFNSILAADFGSVNTRVVLVGPVNGRYRMLAYAQAKTTANPPFGDVGEGLLRALQMLSETTGRTFFNEEGYLIFPQQDDGSGVDRFVATASGGQPMRAVLIGLVPEISLDSGRRAANATYMTIEDTIHLADTRSEVDKIESILNIDPDVLLIVGGTDGGAVRPMLGMINLAEVVLSLMPAGHRPRVIYAGNVELQSQVQEMLQNEEVDVRFADNVRPSLTEETLESAQARLASVYDDYMSGSPGGFREISQWSKVGVKPTAQSFSQVLGFLEVSQRGAHKPVLGVDLGSATTTLAAAWRGRRYVNVRSDLGLGHSAVTALEGGVNLDAVARWLSFETDPEDLRDYAWNKWLRPGTVPQDTQDLEIEMAFAREIIRVALEGARSGWRRLPRKGRFLPESDMIVLAGAVFGKAPHPGHAALLGLDALQPVGVSQFMLDSFGLISGMGALSYLSAASEDAALVVSHVMGAGGLEPLCTVVAPMGRIKPGQTALSVTVTVEGQTRDTVDVAAGTLRVIPLEPGLSAEVMVEPHRRLDLGGGSGKAVAFSTTGSILGLVCDARSRPLILPSAPGDRARIYLRWTEQVAGRARPAGGEAGPPEAEEDLAFEEEEILEEPEDVLS